VVLFSLQLISFIFVAFIAIFPGGEAYRLNGGSCHIDTLHLSSTLLALFVFISTTSWSVFIHSPSLESKNFIICASIIFLSIFCFLIFLIFVTIQRSCKGKDSEERYLGKRILNYSKFSKKRQKMFVTCDDACTCTCRKVFNYFSWFFELWSFLFAFVALILNSFLNNLYEECLHL
jgi:hypothetical protein